ncbi:putative cell wall proline rich protein [Rosellinia necatrix]|uniref:Putative cell wall proline rich protein n=1 Tax=Rosellinia necatrix TaxID=77044 RepID=A0A1S7UJQ1_ROSNE|nr:putative cell wall proline rich protein [Rosellinia necatrix]
MDEVVIGEMNNVTTQLAASTFSQDTMASSVSPQPSPRINLPPPPNPPFTFPTRPSLSAPSSLSKSTGRRHQSAIEIPKIGLGVEYPDSRQAPAPPPDFSFNPGSSLSPESTNRRPRPAPLPDFSFNPGAAPTIDSSLLSPSFAPPSPRTIPTHMGHRRGGSEFVGGSLKSGEPITLMSTSPTRSESGFASPTPAPSNGPRRHQRGHSHRRSGAISSHDLSLILQSSPSPSSRGSSAPASPAGFREQYTFPDVKDNSIEAIAPRSSAAVVGKEDAVMEKPSQSLPELSSKPVARARVGFSDTLEFIPRPLSLVSTDTASTVRPGHSVSGSISSIASMTNSMNPDRDSPATLGVPVPRTNASSRPSTAGAVLERTSSLHVPTDGAVSPRRRNSILILNDLTQTNAPTSAMSTPTKTPKRWTFFGFDSFVTTGSPTKPRASSTGSLETTAKDGADPVPSASDSDPVRDSRASECLSPVGERKTSIKKRRKKVKFWAGSILTRRSKSRAQKSKPRRRSQTPPIIRFTRDDDVDYDFSEPTGRSARTDLGASLNQSRPLGARPPRHRRPHLDDEASYPMIDLDAALGPFNTPTRDPQWEEAQRAGAPPKRQLHSAAGMRGFSGPGMHYHRRAESAPEMPPFEGARFGIHRFGSSSTMADVFEEDEEDDDTTESAPEDSNSESQDTTTGDEAERRETDDAASTPRQDRAAELASPQPDIPMAPLTKSKERDPGLDPPTPLNMSDDITPSTLFHEAAPEEHISPLPIRRDVIFASPFEARDPATRSPRNDTNQMESIPPDATSIILSGPPAMPSPYPISHSSSFPSPCSPRSYDAHRISTAPSSITDENQFHSLLMGEPGPELVRLSIEVSSVASTNSTMTRESNFIPGPRPRNMPFHEQRPASFTSAAFGRRRSSLASLSRLISSAHGERSKLSMEVPFENEAEKKTKASKSKRLTRMMQFWKPKATNGS